MAFFNKYPYTDFHELNADWIIEQITTFQSQVNELTDRVTAAEATVEAMESRVSTLESEMDTAESNITSLQAAATDAAGRIAALEGADIQDAAVLSDLTDVSAGANSVEISFSKDTYTDGNRTSTESDTAIIPAATTSAAGVITPGEKSKLNAFSVDPSGNATFTGRVSGNTPTGNSDFVTKQYADSLAITGVSPVKVESDALMTWRSITDVSFVSGQKIGYKYGAMRQVNVVRNRLLTVNAITPGQSGWPVVAVYNFTDSDFTPGSTEIWAPCTILEEASGLNEYANAYEGLAYLYKDSSGVKLEVLSVSNQTIPAGKTLELSVLLTYVSDMV